jgi:hypothetical protein
MHTMLQFISQIAFGTIGAMIALGIIGGLVIAFDHDVANKEIRVHQELQRRGMR